MLTGCPPTEADNAAGPVPSKGSSLAANVTAKTSGGTAGSSGNPVFANQVPAAPATRLRVVQLDVYQLVVPLGAISRSEEFWKHVDEQSVDVGTYDLLRKNGWRLGLAPTAEWNYFRDIIDAYPASSKPTGISAAPGGGGGAMEMMMKHGVPYQNIFYFTDANALFGRTYEECDNLLNITLQQAPRKAGEARITVCPTVRGIRKRFEVVNRDNEKEREIRYVHPERLYDLNCQVDVPIGQFLLIAPSPEVKWQTSLGATFLVQDGPAERLEQVLLFVPHVAELEETTR
jgi:hypothetical protein